MTYQVCIFILCVYFLLWLLYIVVNYIYIIILTIMLHFLWICHFFCIVWFLLIFFLIFSLWMLLHVGGVGVGGEGYVSEIYFVRMYAKLNMCSVMGVLCLWYYSMFLLFLLSNPQFRMITNCTKFCKSCTKFCKSCTKFCKSCTFSSKLSTLFCNFHVFFWWEVWFFRCECCCISRVVCNIIYIFSYKNYRVDVIVV